MVLSPPAQFVKGLILCVVTSSVISIQNVYLNFNTAVICGQYALQYLSIITNLLSFIPNCRHFIVVDLYFRLIRNPDRINRMSV